MGIKKVLAMVLAATVLFGSVSVSAATSSQSSYNPATGMDEKNTQMHENAEVTSKINAAGTEAEVVNASRTAKTTGNVVLDEALGPKGAVPITAVKAGAFKPESGKKAVTVIVVKSKKQVKFAANALKDSKVKKIVVKNAKSVKLAKNALKGGQKKVKIYFSTKSAAKNFKYSTKSFKGAKVTISGTKAAKKTATYKKLKKNAKKLGITVL